MSKSLEGVLVKAAHKKQHFTQEQIEEFAKKAAAIRFGAEQLENITIDYNELVTPTRSEDNGNDLWSVFNVIQEKLTHGMFNYQTGTKMRKARKIKNFRQDIDLNDLDRAANWGIYQGRPVIVDVGGTSTVIQQYYDKKKKQKGINSDARAIAMEFGTANVAPQPYLRPALESNSSLIVNDLSGQIKTSIEKYKAKQARKTK